MPMRGVRGATTVARDTEEDILAATQELLYALVDANGIDEKDIASAFFTVTDDLSATFPAKAARLMGWSSVPLMDAREIPVPDSIEHCIRVMLLWNTARVQEEIVHVYQGEARVLRPDLVEDQGMAKIGGKSQ